MSIFLPSCRYWQDLGYLIVYVTGRPDMQKQRVVAWLSQHNFPHGIVSFCDGLVHDPLRHKANFLKSLINEVRRLKTIWLIFFYHITAKVSERCQPLLTRPT